jgi:hypothetical protein
MTRSFYRNKALAGNRADHMSNSLQLIKKLQRGLLQTKRHLWFSSFAPQNGQQSHQFSSFSSRLAVERGSVSFMI